MNRLLICPSERPDITHLALSAPLAIAPLLGQGLLEYWLSHLACSGAKSATVLAHDRPEDIRALIGGGERWGMELKVLEESRELTPAQALLKYSKELDPVPPADAITVLDHFPGFPELPLFTSYANWFTALCQWMPRAVTPDRVGMRPLVPGVWVGTDSHVSPESQLVPPCWVGKHVFVGRGAVVGPNVILEDGAFVEPAAEIVGSCIGMDTFVGQFARIIDSIAHGDTLINWHSGCATKVPDPFLLCALREPRRGRTASWLGKLAALYVRNKDDVSVLWKHLLLRKEG
jgi:NDP-sugar pyrophosphorylase family protein